MPMMGLRRFGGFAIWMFYDSSQQVAPQIVDDELSQLGISTSFVVNADSDDLDNNPATDRFASYYFSKFV